MTGFPQQICLPRQSRPRLESATPASNRIGSPAASLVVLALAAVASHAVTAPRPANLAAPGTHPHRWFEIGPASWYGRGFEGRRTASGEIFHAGALTCAHPSLPLGSWVRVTNLRNRRSIFVRVTDRGPEFGNRVVDLSSAAARAVGMHGVTRVGLEPVTARTPELERALTAQATGGAGLRMPWTALQPFLLPGLSQGWDAAASLAPRLYTQRHG